MIPASNNSQNRFILRDLSNTKSSNGLILNSLNKTIVASQNINSKSSNNQPNFLTSILKFNQQGNSVNDIENFIGTKIGKLT